MNYTKLIITILLSAFLLQSCGSEDMPDEESNGKAKKAIRNKLVALTGYNAYSYFIYKGQPMGFDYELVRKLADYLNLQLELRVVNDISEMFRQVNSGEGDIIAFNLTITRERLAEVDFTNSINSIRQVLVQRKPDNWENMRLDRIEKQLIRDPVNLIGKTVVARSSSSYLERLYNLSNEIGGDILISEAQPDLTTEDLISMVASGEIDYTISDDNVANLNEAYFRNIDVNTSISLSQRIGWAVKKNNEDLLNLANNWLDSIKKTVDFAVIYKKYFTNRYAYKKRVTSKYFSQTGGGISKYDNQIKKYSETIGWDWRMSASLIYQESQFNPNAKSWAGAAGLMQLMPSTAKQYGATDVFNPDQNIKAGFKYLRFLNNLWADSITDSTERIKFILASYNVGQGHIIDARGLTEKYGGDPHIWYDNVEYYLTMKSKPKYYNDEIVKRGYARGKETVKYVKEILERYEHYKQLIN
ncbi:MAG: transporter substrate-binding domain-containing protein [Ignavibacterium sp.]|nr:MAG: transporter substrate-binding domain-containing protein [Ignavibacterium sp.]